MVNIVTVSADRHDPSLGGPTGDASDDSDSDDATNKHRRDPTLLGIPQGEPRRGGWVEAGGATDPRVHIPEDDDAARSRWNSVAERTGKVTQGSSSKTPPPPAVGARKIQRTSQPRRSSSSPPAPTRPRVTTKDFPEELPSASPKVDEGFAPLSDPNAKNEKLPSVAPPRPSEELIGLSIPPQEPAVEPATTVDVSPPVMDELASSQEVAEAPESPEGLDTAKTTIDTQGPALMELQGSSAQADSGLEQSPGLEPHLDATPLAPISAMDLAQSEVSLDSEHFAGTDEFDSPPKARSGSGKKWVAVGLLLIAAAGAAFWALRNRSIDQGQTVHVIDKAVAPAAEEVENSQDTAEIEKQLPENPDTQSTEAGDPVPDDTVSDTNSEPEPASAPSVGELISAIEDANVPSQSRAIRKMRMSAKIRKARGHVTRATTYLRKKRYDLAIRYFSKALVFTPENEEASEGIMHALEGQGDLEKALTWSKRLIQLDSKNAVYWAHAGDLLRKSGRPADAKLAYERALKENKLNKAAIAGLKALKP